MPKSTLHHGDCLPFLREMESDSIHLTVCSPPYDGARAYHGFFFDFEPIARELYRVTKPGGVVVWVVADETVDGSESGTSFRQALYFKDVCGFLLYDTMLYRKDNPPPLNHRRYEQGFEYMFVLSKGTPTTFNPIKKKSLMAGKQRGGTMRNGGRDDLQPKHTLGNIPKESLRDNVFTYTVGHEQDNAGGKHPAVFPEALARDQILTWSNAGDIVFDPFTGSGTTMKVAYELERDFIGCEISEEYVALAWQRMKNITLQPRMIVATTPMIQPEQKGLEI